MKIRQLPSGNYQTHIFSHVENGKRISKSFTAPTKTEVKQKAEAFLYERKRITAGKITVGEAIDRYIENNKNIFSPSTVLAYRSSQKTDFQNIRNISIERITSEDIQAEVNEMSARLSPKSVRNRYGLLTAAVHAFAPEKFFKVNLPQKVKSEVTIPTEKEVKKLLEAAKDTPLEIPVVLAAFCGLRRSEISAIEWSDIDLKKKTAFIHQTMILHEDYRFKVRQNTKTTDSRRTIILFQPVIEALKKRKKREGRVTSLSPNSIYRRYLTLCDKAEITHYRFHDLRHYAVSVMLALNIPKKYIASYVGHGSERMIDAVYGHIMQTANTSYAEKVNEFYAKM